MTTLELTQTAANENLVQNEVNSRRFVDTVKNIGQFIVNRFTLNGDHQMGRQTVTPVYFHESYPLLGTKIVLGEE